MSQADIIDQIVVDPEHHIPITKKLLVQGLAARPDAPEGFLEFCRLLEAVYHFQNLRVSQELKEDFRLLDREEGRSERAKLTDAEIHEAEMRFLANFLQAMQQANFKLLSQRDIDFASRDEYLFNLPVQIDWSKLDDKLLSGYFRERQLPARIELPEFAQRILIFRRGVGIDQSHGFHFLPKIDAIVTRVLDGCIGLFHRGRPQDDPALGHDHSADTPKSIHDSRRVERISPRNSRLGLRSLFRRTTFQEPTFKELVILFRRAVPEEENTEPDPTICIKAFRDIPMADLEVVFPEKKISMKPLDLIKLVITGAIGLVLFVMKFAFAALLNPVVLLAALATVGGYATKVFFGFKASRDRYQYLVTQSLYHKNLDNDLGVIFYLMDSLESQEFKEAVLAYYCLLTNGESTADELDAYCEQVVHEAFDIEIDFEIEDALTKLTRDELAELGDGCYRAVSIPEALRKLDAKWDDFFQHHAGSDVQDLTAARQDAAEV